MDQMGTKTTQAGPRPPSHVNPSIMLSGGAVSYQKSSNDGYNNEEASVPPTSDSGSVPSLLDINPFNIGRNPNGDNLPRVAGPRGPGSFRPPRPDINRPPFNGPPNRMEFNRPPPRFPPPPRSGGGGPRNRFGAPFPMPPLDRPPPNHCNQGPSPTPTEIASSWRTKRRKSTTISVSCQFRASASVSPSKSCFVIFERRRTGTAGGCPAHAAWMTRHRDPHHNLTPTTTELQGGESQDGIRKRLDPHRTGPQTAQCSGTAQGLVRILLVTAHSGTCAQTHSARKKWAREIRMSRRTCREGVGRRSMTWRLTRLTRALRVALRPHSSPATWLENHRK